MHVMGGGDVGGAKTQIMNTVTGLSRTNDVMLISFRAGPFADEARERGIDVRVIERHNPCKRAFRLPFAKRALRLFLRKSSRGG